MGTSISTKTKAELDLEQLEQEINTEAFEAFYHIGQKLLKIKKLRLYEAAGYKTWAAYCASGRIEYRKHQADAYIRASELRPKVGDIATHDWTMRQMLELCKCETDLDAQRVAKKAIALAKKTGQRVTAKLIAHVRDGADETGAADKKRDARLTSASLETHLEKLADLLVAWRTSLEAISLDQWDDLPPVVLTRVRNEAEALTAFLRS